MPPRPMRIHHDTSLPFKFFGRTEELALLDQALISEQTSVAAFVGPGGQGKTAIAQFWLEQLGRRDRPPAGIFLWSFYRGKDADLCLRSWHAYAEGLSEPSDVSASYCVDRLIELLRRECWAVVLDGTEVVQYESGDWRGRFVHPELARLLEELAGAPMPGVVVVTSRFSLPTLKHRRFGRIIQLSRLDNDSARGLLRSLRVAGRDTELDRLASLAGHHAKAVELLGTYLVRFGDANPANTPAHLDKPLDPNQDEDEQRVTRVLSAFQTTLPAEQQDLIALATAFRDPATEKRLHEYLTSEPVQSLLHEQWQRVYTPWKRQPTDHVTNGIEELVQLRLLERVQRQGGAAPVIDAHPLVRRAFEHVLGPAGRRESANSRAGFLRSRPDRRRPASLEEAREEIELFHSYCDAGCWNEADGTYIGLENPKHRFLAPALERDMLLRFFPDRDWRQRPAWSGFGRYRSLAIAMEMLGQFDEAIGVYRDTDAALRGDALIALGRLEPLLALPSVTPPWDTLWRAYRCHALCLAGRLQEGVALARTLIPVDIYEWVHVFECMMRAGQLALLDLKSVLFRSSAAADHRWAELARRRMRADYLRLTSSSADEVGKELEAIIEEYDKAGLPYERSLARLSHAAWLMDQGEYQRAEAVNRETVALAGQFAMAMVQKDAESMADALVKEDATMRCRP